MRTSSAARTGRKLPLVIGLALLTVAAVAIPAVAIPAIAIARSDSATTAAAAQVTAKHRLAALDSAGLQDELAQVRRVTARFHDVDAARAAGYELGWVNGSGVRILTGCISNPTAGAMGYHFFNPELMSDLSTDLLHPEALVYAPNDDGTLQLAAVEWVVRGQNSNPPGVATPPSVLGMPMHILVPAVGFYVMHAWVWKPNPSGIMADWNPDVSCP